MKVNTLQISTHTKRKILKLYEGMGIERYFSRADIMRILGIKSSLAGDLFKKMKSEILKFLINPDELESFDSELGEIFGWIDANYVIIAISRRMSL